MLHSTLAVSTGANWIAGGGRTDLVNPILALADEFNISYYDQQYNLVGYEKGSTVPVDAKDVEKQVKEFLKARDCLDEISWAGKCGIALFRSSYRLNVVLHECSYFLLHTDWATAEANEFISTPPGQNARQGLGSCGWELPADGSFRQALETTFIENDFLHSPEQTSTYNFGDSTFWDFGPENNFVRNGGIEEIAQQYAQTEGLVPNIQFGKDVVEIHYGGVAGELTSVTTADGCEYKATTIIFTPSLEVAKKMEEASVFSPALSPGVARSPLTADAWVRTYFHFNQTFWDTSGQWLAIGTERRGECSVWLNYDYQGSEGSLYPGSGIISCVLDQNTVDALLAREQKEVLDAEFAKEDLLNPLRATYPSTFVEPTDVLITDWKNDPTAYGSWENFPFGNDLSGYYDYFTPRNDKLFLSGSGSCLRYWGYMHGAYYAGIRDAEWAIATMNGGGQTVARADSFCDDMNDF